MDHIEGIPAGWKLVRVGTAKKGEYLLDANGTPSKQYRETCCPNYAIITPANVYNLPLSEVPIPAGYELAGKDESEWFRVPVRGDSYISSPETGCGLGQFMHDEPSGYHTSGPDHRRLIIRPIKRTKQVLVVEFDNPSVYEREAIEALIPSKSTMETRTI